MIDSMFQDGTSQVLDDRVARPVAERPAPPPSFGISLWNTAKAPVTGVVAGAGESAAFGSDVLGAFGAVQAGFGMRADPAMLFDASMRERAKVEGEQARADVESGAAFSTELGTDLRANARDLMPDPQTANVVEQTLFGLTRFATKAVGYSVVAGPVPGAALTGADEGMSEADRLKSQGVDLTTRTKVGAVAGLSAAAATALPIAGKTIPQTVGLVAVGGPGGFIAQQAASRAILQHASYDKLADQYDPFDPVGLAVSTLVPAAFGAHAMRSQGARTAAPAADPAAARELSTMGRNERVALRYDDPRLDAYTVTAAQKEGVPPELLLALKNAGEKSNPGATSPKGAQGVAQLMPPNQRKYGVTDPHDPMQSIDGMARYVRDTMKQYDGNVQAVIADYNGGPKAAKRVLQGMSPEAAETVRYLSRVNDYLAEHQGKTAGRAAAADPEAVAAARVQLVRDTVESWNLKDPTDIAGAQDHLNAVLRASDQIGAGARVDITDTINLDNLGKARLLDDFAARLEANRADLLPDAAGMAEPGAIASMRDELQRLQQSIPAATDEALRARAKEIQAEGGSYKKALATAQKEFQDRTTELSGRIDTLTQQIERHGEAARANEQVRQLDAQIAQVKADRAAIDAPTPKPAALAVKQAIADMGSAKSSTGKVGEKADESGTKTGKVAHSDLPPAAKLSAEPLSPVNGTDEKSPAVTSLANQTAEIARLAPDLMVQLEGMEKPMRLADALEAVEAEAAKDVKDAPLFQVAAECFLRSA